MRDVHVLSQMYFKRARFSDVIILLTNLIDHFLFTNIAVPLGNKAARHTYESIYQNIYGVSVLFHHPCSSLCGVYV